MITVTQTIVQMMLKICHILSRGLMVLACFLFALLVLMVFSGAVMRYLVGTPLAIADETASLLFLAGAVLTLTYGYMEKKLIRISLIWDSLSKRRRYIANVVGTLVGAAVVFVISRATFTFAWDAFEMGTRTVMTDIPVWPWAMSIPLSLFILALTMVLTAISDLLGILSNRKQPAKG